MTPQIGEVFRILDRDEDGKITRQELEEVLSRLDSALLAEEEVAFMVRLADTDGDGCVTMEELCELSGPAGESELVGAFRASDTLDDCRRIIESIDSDGNGFIDFGDFDSMMRPPQ